MVKELMHDPIFLSLKSEVATNEDLQVATFAKINTRPCAAVDSFFHEELMFPPGVA